MDNFTLHIPQIQAAEELATELEKVLSEPLMSRVYEVHFELFKRLKIQMEITEFLNSKLIVLADSLE